MATNYFIIKKLTHNTGLDPQLFLIPLAPQPDLAPTQQQILNPMEMPQIHDPRQVLSLFPVRSVPFVHRKFSSGQEFRFHGFRANHVVRGHAGL